jgi:hypothetical protein
LNQAFGVWWSERSAVEKAALVLGASALGAGDACAVASHGLVLVTPKFVIALGPAASVLAKSVALALAV